jgi:exodeoxyribonuclease-3
MMKVATFNANSIRTRLPALLTWVKREDPHVLFLQETKVQDKDFPAQAIRDLGYHVVFRGQKAYNGVAIVSKSRIYNVRSHLYQGEDPEARFVSGIVRGIPVLNVYVPQGYAPETDRFVHKLMWLKDLLSHLKENYMRDQPLLMAGDFNVALEPKDVYDPEALRGQVGFHPDEQSILQEFLDWGLVDIFRRHQRDEGHFTFWDYRIPNAVKRNLGWRIDYIFATPLLAERSRTAWIDKAYRTEPKPSDHTFLVAEFDQVT